MRIVRLFTTAAPEANLLAASSSLLLLIKITILNRLPEAFSGARELGLISEGVLISILASYIFYLIVVHLKEQSEKAALSPYIEKHAHRIIGDCMVHLMEINKLAKTSLDLKSVTEKEIADAFLKFAPSSPTSLELGMGGPSANWFQFSMYQRERTKECLRKLFDQLPFLGAGLVSQLAAVDDCFYFIQVPRFADRLPTNNDMEVWAETFFDYCNLCRELDSVLVKQGFRSALP